MTNHKPHHVFLSYNPDNQEFVEALARRLRGDARLSFWFSAWHSVPGVPIQEQMETALWEAQACALFIGGGSGQIESWQNEQMRVAIQTRVEDETSYRVIPVLLPGAASPKRRDLPPFLRRYEMVEFQSLDDEQAFKRLLAGILGIPPIRVEGYIQTGREQEQLVPPPSDTFEGGHGLVIGIANYPRVNTLPEIVLKDARDLGAVLTDRASCGYSPANVTGLFDDKATASAIRAALTGLARRTGPDDTAVVFFSGHGAYDPAAGDSGGYLLPYDADPANLPGTALRGDEMTALLRDIPAGRLLVLFDSCHSGGAGDPKGAFGQLKTGLSEGTYQALAQGKGRVVIASSRPDEVSWALQGMNNSLFTYYLLEGLRGQAKTLGDGYVRVFDLFRHVADHVPARAAQINASQHPIFKAAAVEEDFALAFAPERRS
jgi:hypothetical protein